MSDRSLRLLERRAGVCVGAAIVGVDHLESAWRDAPERWRFRSLNQELLNAFECPCVHHERLLRRWQRRAGKTLLLAAAGALAVDGDRAKAEAEVRRWVEVALRAWALAD